MCPESTLRTGERHAGMSPVDTVHIRNWKLHSGSDFGVSGTRGMSESSFSFPYTNKLENEVKTADSLSTTGQCLTKGTQDQGLQTAVRKTEAASKKQSRQLHGPSC